MSGAEQFTAAVPERSGPTDWRGGLERSGARRGRVGDELPLPRSRAARGKYRARRRAVCVYAKGALPVVFAANRIGVNAVLLIILQTMTARLRD